MSSLFKLLAFLPLALAADPSVLNPGQAMIFKESDFAVRNGKRGIELSFDENCMSLDGVPDRMNVGSIYVPCSSDSSQDNMCIIYSDNSCGNEMFTFTRPHANLFRQTKGDDVGRQVKSIKCMIARSPLDRKGHIFTSDRPSTKSASSCSYDTCTSDEACRATHPNYNLSCSLESNTCQQQSPAAGACDSPGAGCGPDSVCRNGLCKSKGELSPCINNNSCAVGLECRPYRATGPSGGSIVEKICMKVDDVRGKQCSSNSPCAEHMMCSLQSEGNVYCEGDGTCGLKELSCQSHSQCCSGNCLSQKCQ
ncbi:hypothetical protein N7452_010437 [Penicillium brevicompactum]|uniref:Uncharacterized protein n=1 Tax=Penicillium brevicompactum TaxID=5074 RepID=A0A9W9UB22_PENBR|nr:hypothetical protein N7452_010437 [Penicillium brevicompactum]